VLFRNRWALHAKELQEILETWPGVARALTTPIEQLEQNTLTLVKELCQPPCCYIFNMINDIDRMDRQGESVSKIEIYPRAWHESLIVLLA
jgi:hypothetical protein